MKIKALGKDKSRDETTDLQRGYVFDDFFNTKVDCFLVF